MEIKLQAPHAIDATLSPQPRLLDGVEVHDNLTHCLISMQVPTEALRAGRPVFASLEANLAPVVACVETNQ